MISEFMAANDSMLLDGHGEYSDWIELYNFGDDLISLAGWALTDDPSLPDRWVFPERDLSPGEYLVVFASDTPLRFDPPRAYPDRRVSAVDRTLTFCSLYDNGFSDPDEVKRKSTSPQTPIGVPGLAGGPCVTPTDCTEGLVGERCSGNTQAARDASCDSSPGAGDGFCDACTLRGGVTTEDEMFILMGGFYVQ